MPHGHNARAFEAGHLKDKDNEATCILGDWVRGGSPMGNRRDVITFEAKDITQRLTRNWLVIHDKNIGFHNLFSVISLLIGNRTLKQAPGLPLSSKANRQPCAVTIS